MKLSDLNMDKYLLSLRKLNETFVNQYRRAYRLGAEMPKIVIDKQTNTIVSGNHRYSALLREFGEDHEIEVIAKEFSSRAEILKEFAKQNATHGNPLSAHSRQKIVLELKKYEVDEEEIAYMLNLTRKYIETCETTNHRLVQDKKGRVESKPIKPNTEIPADVVMTEEQYKTHEKSHRSGPITSWLQQIIQYIDWGFVSKENEKQMNLLRELKRKLDSFLD